MQPSATAISDQSAHADDDVYHASAMQSQIRQSGAPHSTVSAARLARASLQSISHCGPGLLPCKRILPSKRSVFGDSKPAANAVAYVCAASKSDLDTIIHGLIAVKQKNRSEQQHAVRFLIDTGASQKSLSTKINAAVRSKPETLSMANGSLAHSKGTMVLPINLQDYWDEAVFKIFPMNNAFDVILGRDWCNQVSCDILYSLGVVKFLSPSTGKFHELILQPVSHGTVCPVISSVDLDKHIETSDTVYTCHVTAQDNESNTHDHDKVQVVLEQYKDVFPDELPAELPPESQCISYNSTQGQQCCTSCTQNI